MAQTNQPEGPTFPCILDIKVFLTARDNNLELVKDVLLRTVSADNFRGISRKESKHGRYHSFSCKVYTKDKTEADALFEKLSSHPEVLMVI